MPVHNEVPEPVPPLPKMILYYTKVFDMENFAFGFGREPFLNLGCPVNNCFATNNRSFLEDLSDFDAIMFHSRNMNTKHLDIPDQSKRKPHQRYVFFSKENPAYDTLQYKELAGIENGLSQDIIQSFWF